jgi:hypothetical protein
MRAGRQLPPGRIAQESSRTAVLTTILILNLVLNLVVLVRSSILKYPAGYESDFNSLYPAYHDRGSCMTSKRM